MQKFRFIFLVYIISIKAAFADSIVIKNARTRVPVSGACAIYFDIFNNSEKDLNIVGASANEISNNVFLRNSFVDFEGTGRTVNINKILIPKDTEISFKPEGMHIVISNLKKELKLGDEFLLRLQFDNEYTKIFKVIVKSLNYSAKN